jgi:hypothetical protein
VADADAAQQALAATISRLIEGAIPLAYERKKDWDATTQLPVGGQFEGKPFHWHFRKREVTVNHGVWKHYKLRLVDPRQNLRVQLEPLRPIGLGRVGFTLHIVAKVDAWARAKVYHYGVHVIALEAEGDLRANLRIDGEIGLEVRRTADGTSLAVIPVIANSRIELDELHLWRVSNADGSLVRVLGRGLRQFAEDELNGPQLTAKLNRAIEKKRDRLTFRPADFFRTAWWPMERLTAAPTGSAANPSLESRGTVGP